MQTRNFIPDLRYVKTYKTVATMERAIAKHPMLDAHHYSTHTYDNGRITPVFHYNAKAEGECPVICIVHLGYSAVDGIFNVHSSN
tara:strand:+ start:528 stop:782 length:255 start_codon:yes stop_codon:yes gene_type:complete